MEFRASAMMYERLGGCKNNMEYSKFYALMACMKERAIKLTMQTMGRKARGAEFEVLFYQDKISVIARRCGGDDPYDFGDVIIASREFAPRTSSRRYG